MLSLKKLIIGSILGALSLSAFSYSKDPCCNKMGGIKYSDSSSGRFVCNNGFVSTCYSTQHAVMDLQLLRGCCLWKGGVKTTYDTTGVIRCNDGSISEECTLPNQSASTGIF